MFGWFSPSCPVDLHAKAWIEKRLNWLASEFGLDVFTKRALILPLEEFFPERYDRSEHSVYILFQQVCGYMDVDPDMLELKFYKDNNQLGLVNDKGQLLPGAAGLYEESDVKTVIHLENSQLDEPMTLVGTIAHELAHVRLLGENRIRPTVFDNELLTDLTVVFHGLGIFLANVPRASESDMSYWPKTDARRTEYMSQSMYGYALAHMAWFRNERQPDWSRHLRLDARASFKQGLNYLWKTGDSTFKPKHAQ